MLFKFAFRLGLGIALSVVVVVAFARAQTPPDDVRSFLSSDGITCFSPAPCFFGIQPGETRANEVFRLLEAHSWVEEFYIYRGMESDSGLVQWTWSGQQPDYIDSTTPASLWFQHGVVNWIEVDLNLTFGDIWLLLDAPQTGRIYMMSSTPPRAYQLVDYQNRSLQVRSEFGCPLHLAAFWRAKVRVTTSSTLAPWQRDESAAYRLPYPRGCM